MHRIFVSNIHVFSDLARMTAGCIYRNAYDKQQIRNRGKLPWQQVKVVVTTMGLSSKDRNVAE